MRLALSLLVCIALFAFTNASPPKKRCCDPGPGCDNPCGAPMGMMQPDPFAMQQPMMAPPPYPMYGQAPDMQMAPPMQMVPPMQMGGDPSCCDPMMTNPCMNPCAPQGSPPPPAAPPIAYNPNPGEITVKLMQTWDPDKFLDENSAGYKLLAGNLVAAVKAALRNYYGRNGGSIQEPVVSNIYFREGYVPGNPSTMPKVVAHFMVNGGSDDASILQKETTPDGSLGDGFKVYRDSFNAY
ncbi:uncharacterized protein LOC5521084 [Nematostella vectensis]|uniref:uncharacterized protein LOC5521084 n=1 Tax=Nematostella vectensis TaxID=45351 RepID=UPI0020777753|nr:uncharacterized protein LOC5521084 [Nematostella vectensis]